MASVRIFPKTSVVGLDLGSSAIKMAELVRKDGRLALMRTGLKEIHAGADPLPSTSNSTVQALKDLVKGINRKRTAFVVTANCERTAVRVVSVPPMPKGELAEAVKLEAQNYFPFPVEDAFLDFEVLGEITEKGVRKLRVAVATAPEKMVRDCVSLLRQVGIRPASFIPAAYALQHLAAVSPIGDDRARCLAEIGQRFTEWVIKRGNDLIFARKIPVGGSDFTEALTGVLVSDRGRMELTSGEAERLKREVGIPAEGEPPLAGGRVPSSQIIAMLRSPIETLAGEMERCLDYYREESGGGKVETLDLFGAGALLKGIVPHLSDHLGFPVRLGNPLLHLAADFSVALQREEFVSYAGAVGAALSLGKGINLLPPELKEETKRLVTRATLQSAAAAFVLILAFIHIGMRIQLSNFEKRIAVAKLEIGSLQYNLKEAEVQSLVQELMAGEPYWEDVFKELSHKVPEDLYLRDMRVRDKTVTLRGTILSHERENALSEFILALGNGIFKSVKLISAKELPDQNSSEFELACEVG